MVCPVALAVVTLSAFDDVESVSVLVYLPRFPLHGAAREQHVDDAGSVEHGRHERLAHDAHARAYRAHRRTPQTAALVIRVLVLIQCCSVPALAALQNTGEMRVMWTSAAPNPVVRYGLQPGQYTWTASGALSCRSQSLRQQGRSCWAMSLSCCSASDRHHGHVQRVDDVRPAGVDRRPDVVVRARVSLVLSSCSLLHECRRDPGLLHNVLLTGLQWNGTVYYYSFGVNGFWSPEYRFR